jgi:hypothetical protein
MRGHVAVLIVIAAGAAGGCGGAQDTSANGSVAEADFAAVYVDAVCGLAQACCSSAAYPNDDADCRARLSPIPKSGPPDQTTYDAANAKTCIGLIHTFATACSFSQSDRTRAVAACNAVYVGQVKVGAPCFGVFACAGSYEDKAFCGGPTVTSMTCQLVDYGNAGDACNDAAGVANVHDGCASGLYCSRSVGICKVLPQEGQACEPWDIVGYGVAGGCVDGLYCKNGVCVPKAANGEPCTDDIDCQSGVCGTASTCAASGPHFTRETCPLIY